MGKIVILIEKDEIGKKNILKHYPDEWKQFVLLNTDRADFHYDEGGLYVESRDFLYQTTTNGFSKQKKEWAVQHKHEDCTQHFYIDKMEVPKNEFIEAVNKKSNLHPYLHTTEKYVLYDKKHDIFLLEEKNK